LADVSVVIPAYNSAATLGRALDSVLAQTVPAREILVIDDGSTDGTPALVAARYPTVTCVVQPNAGAAAARNHGVRLARGAYVAFVDADDEWAPTKLERQLAVFAAQPGIGLLACLVVFVRDGSRTPEVPPHPDRQVDELRYAELLAGRGGYFVSASYVLRREVFLAVGGFDESLRSGHDTEFFLRVMHRGWSFRVLHEPLYVWHQDEGSLSGGGVSPKRSVNIVKAMRAQPHPRERALGVSLVSDAEYDRAVATAVENAAIAHGNAGQWEAAGSWFRELAATAGASTLGRARAALGGRDPEAFFRLRGSVRAAVGRLRGRG
jgi:glycosyltransferase involved in cell wall biosynthesis